MQVSVLAPQEITMACLFQVFNLGWHLFGKNDLSLDAQA